MLLWKRYTIKTNTVQRSKPEGGLQASLCSNFVLPCSSPLGFNSSNSISEDDALDYLAEVLVDSFLDHKKYYANATTQKGGDLCPSINKRTS
jgi:hypothetical protein